MRSVPENPFLTREGIARLARLARLRLAPEEIDALAPKLAHVLGHIERIAEIPDAELPDPEPPAATILREDRPVAGTGSEELSRNAAVTAHGLVPVPLVVGSAR
jgi:aspartyl-tRNA(Asn)/glutamyl-tRNA(Gln) amidotransferase subunit C